MKAIIMAGGKGTRLKEITLDDIPKPMALINNKPILEHQILRLKENGITDITLVVGYLKEKIISYFNTGSGFGVSIKYIQEDEPLGTAGALYYLKDNPDDDYLLVFGDTIFDIDISKMHAFHKEKKSLVTLFVHPNSHPFDSDLIIYDDNNLVSKFDSKNNNRDYYYHNVVNGGFYIFNKEVLNMINQPVKVDFDKEIVAKLIKESKVYAYRSTEYIKDAGTVDRITSVAKDLKEGVVSSKNLKSKQKCIFLDRDGTINVYKGFITQPDDIELIDGASSAIKSINKSKYLAIVVTNQPIVARGDATYEMADYINAALETKLGHDGAYIDDLMFCPHHPDRGFEGENLLYKIECNCRKPKTGMIEHFVAKYNIDVSQSYIIGDDDRDIQTGINAGLKTIRIGKNDKVNADKEFPNILDAVNYILK